MLELSRTVRFCLSEDGSLATNAPVANAYAFWPPMRGLGRYYELTVTCRGEADPVTGYFLNIREIDRAARESGLPLVEAAAQGRRSTALGSLVQDMITAVDRALDGCVIRLELALSPTYRIAIEKTDMASVLISNDYEFSAAHRLHAEGLSDEENRQVFGKCNNPAGHGHNYRVQVTVRSPIDTAGRPTSIEAIDTLVDRVVIDRLDHKHLNLDVPEFRDVNSSVENIARVVYHMLRDEVKALGVELDEVRVWETGKTVCTYRG